MFSIVGSVDVVTVMQMRFANTAFEDNIGTILQCLSSEWYDDADADGNGGVFEIHTVSF